MLACKGIFAKPSMMQLRKAQDSEAVKICSADFPAIIIPHFSNKGNPHFTLSKHRVFMRQPTAQHLITPKAAL